MKPLEAFQIVEVATARLRLNRQQHQQVVAALNVLHSLISQLESQTQSLESKKKQPTDESD